MKKFNKGMVIASTVAAALAAVTFAGCADAQDIEKKETAPAVTAANKTVAAQAADNKTETAKTEKAETKTETKKADKKKKSTKKNTKKDEKETKTETAQNTQQAAQPAKAPEVVIPETVIPADVYPVWVEGDAYAGSYVEEIAGRGSMDITRNSDGTYSVNVRWASSAFETNYWNFSGEFNGRGCLKYTNCRKTTEAYNEDGSYTYDSDGIMTPYTVYSAGSGYIEFKNDGVLEWHDDMGDIIPGTVFVTRTNTKADEIGTAGSNYYANEADQGGWAGCRYYENEEQEMGGYAGCNYFKNEGFFTGCFYDVNGSRVWLEITKSNLGDNLYNCFVTCPVSNGSYYVYGCLAHRDGDMLVFDNGAKSYIEYDADGNVVNDTIVEKDHFGHIRYSDIGLEWFDSNGTNMSGSYYVFTNGNM